MDFDYIESHASGATLLQNLRYVDDGNIVTSSAVSSGIDATFHLVDRFAGRATALEVAHQFGYPFTAALDDPRFAPPENACVAIGLVAGYEAPQKLGVLLYDGVSEFGMAALLDPISVRRPRRHSSWRRSDPSFTHVTASSSCRATTSVACPLWIG